MLYLFRRHLQDSGGPGRYRGGRSGELAYTMYDAPNDHREGLFAGTGAEMPNAIGLAGGMPGAAIRVARVVNTDVAQRLAAGAPLPDSLDAIAGRREILCCKHERTPLARGDVWYHSWQAGGGYGDPLLREPERVAEDVARRAVSATAARDIYGVVLSELGLVDTEQTAARREQIRKDRLNRAVPARDGGAFIVRGHGRHRYGDVIRADLDRGGVACGYCGTALGARGENLMPRLGAFTSPLRAAGPVRGEEYDERRFALRHVCCPQCGGLIDVQVALEGAPRPHIELDYV